MKNEQEVARNIVAYVKKQPDSFDGLELLVENALLYARNSALEEAASLIEDGSILAEDGHHVCIAAASAIRQLIKTGGTDVS